MRGDVLEVCDPVTGLVIRMSGDDIDVASQELKQRLADAVAKAARKVLLNLD